MKKWLITSTVVIALLCSVYGITHTQAIEGVSSVINNIAVSVSKVGAVILPNEFSAPYAEADTLNATTPYEETIKTYLTNRGFNFDTDVLYDRGYRMEHDTWYGHELMYTYELLRFTRTENGDTFDLYYSARGDIYYMGEQYEYMMVDGLYIEFYKNESAFSTYNADAIAIGRPTITELNITALEVINGEWMD